MRRVGDIIDQIDLHGENRELTDELVELSTRYGILTPYTSFLADETTNLHAQLENTRRARESLQIQLGQVSGAAGVGQRANKQDYAKASRFGAPYAPTPTAAPSDGASIASGPAPAGGEAGYRLLPGGTAELPCQK